MINQIFDTITAPFHALPPVASLALLSLTSALVLLTVFKKLSNQEKIKYHKNKIFGHFLEIAIYRDHFRRTVICQVNVLKHNILYMRYFMTPILIMMIPMSIICLQLDYRMGSSPLHLGDSFIIQAVLDPSKTPDPQMALSKISIKTSDNITLESESIQIPSNFSIYWRAKLSQIGSETFIKIALSGEERLTKAIATNEAETVRFSPDRRKINTLIDIIYSAEQPIPPESNFLRIRNDYQAATYPFLFWQISPIVYFFILTLGFGLLLKPVMKVNI